VHVTDTLTFVALAGAAAAGMIAILKLLRAIIGWIRSAQLMGERVARTMEIVEKELTPNGGSSMKDHVRKTHDRFAALEGRVLVLENAHVVPSGRRDSDPGVVVPHQSLAAPPDAGPSTIDGDAT
jgi:hypothetical protein